jgi:hypothetical protein
MLLSSDTSTRRTCGDQTRREESPGTAGYAYKKEGPKFMQRLGAKQKARGRESSQGARAFGAEMFQ